MTLGIRLERLNGLLKTLGWISRNLLVFRKICCPVKQCFRLNGEVNDIDVLAFRFVLWRRFFLHLGLWHSDFRLLENEWNLLFFGLFLLGRNVFDHVEERGVLHWINLNSEALGRILIILFLNLLQELLFLLKVSILDLSRCVDLLQASRRVQWQRF